MHNVIPSNTPVLQENPYLLSVCSSVFHETVSGRYWLNFQQTEIIVLWFCCPLLHYSNGCTSPIFRLTSYMNSTFHCGAVSMCAWMERGQTLNLPGCNNDFFFFNYNQYSPLFVGFCNPKCILAQLSVYWWMHDWSYPRCPPLTESVLHLCCLLQQPAFCLRFYSW